MKLKSKLVAAAAAVAAVAAITAGPAAAETGACLITKTDINPFFV